MQIKIQLNSDCTSKISENVVQKILAASNARQNEIHHDWMYIQVSSTSYCKIVNNHYRHQWSLCSVDKLKLNFIYLFVRIFLQNNDWWPFYSRLLQLIHMSNNRQYHHQQCERFKSPASTDIVTIYYKYHHHQPSSSTMYEAASNKNLMINKNFITFFHLKTTSKFYMKFYKILLNLFYGHFNIQMLFHYLWYQPLHPTAFNSVNEFCDLSTNSENLLFIINENDNNNVKCINNNNNNNNNNKYIIYVKYGIEYHRYVVKSTTSSLTTEKLRNGLRTLNFFYEILLIQCHVILCNNYEFSNNQCERINNLIMRHQILRHLLEHNQIMLYITSICHYYIIFKFYTTDRSTLSIDNGIAAIKTTSNHKLKMSHDDNDNCYHQQHRNTHHNVNMNEKFSNCFQHFSHRPLFRSNDSVKSHLNAILFLIILCIPLLTTAAASSVHNLKYSTNVVKTKYGPIRGIVMRQNPTVEGYLGVPYATPPLGSLRYMPPVTPSTWKNTRLADHFAPVCPQTVPVTDTGMEALLEMPRGRLAQLRRMKPLLANYSEDCLYLNMYVPREDESGASIDKPMATLVYIHGESYEWNSGNLYDGTVLAAHSKIIVVTINFRLGILGFLKTGTKASSQGNFGLMDLVAGLHWLRENLPAFNGNPNMVTLMGHGHGAALANILIVSPVASDLIHRTILISGSALSPWAIQRDPLAIKKKVATDTGCHGDLLDDDIAPCLRKKSISDLLAIKLDPPRFLPGFAPFVDGTVIVNPAITPITQITIPMGAAIAGPAGIELADFPSRQLLFAVTSIESYLDFSAQDLEFGFNETRRDRILRTYVRNAYHFHLNEIFSALKNEYTYWEQPPRNQLGSRDAALELLSDGHTVAPLVRLGYLHSLRGGKSYFMQFKHRTSERDFPQRFGTVRGEDVPFCFGLPMTPLFSYNYTQQDIQTSRILIHYLANFIKTGNPNGDATPSNKHSIEMDSLKRLGSTSHLVESLPAPSSLLSSSDLLMSSQLHHQQESNHENQHHIDMLNISSAISRSINNDNDNRIESVGTSISDKDNVDNVIESIQSQQHQTQFIYHALSSTNNRHRRSLTDDIGSRNFKQHLMKRYIVKRNFPNNQLSKSTDDMNDDDSNEIELDGIDDGENDDYVKGEDEEDGDEQNNKNGQHDRLDDDDNESDLVKSKMDVPYWDAYDTVNQLFLEMNMKPAIKNHYRGHKLSMWLSLIPQIHSPGDSPDLSMRHHHFIEENPQFYDGKVRLQRLERPTVIKISAPLTTVTPKHKTEKTPSPLMPSLTTECPSNTTIVPTLAATRPHQNQDNNSNNSLFRRLTSNSQYQSYATALTVTIAVGCFLLLLNVFIFAAIYYQREKRATYTKKKEELTEAEHHHSSSSPSLERYQQKGSRKSSLQSVSGTTFGEYSCYDEKIRCKEKRALVDLCTVELPMQDYKYSPPCGSTTGSIRRSITPDNYVNKHTMMDTTTTQDSYTILPTYSTPQINDTNNLVTYRSVIVPKAELCNQATQADSPPRVHDASTIVDENDQDLNPISDLPVDIPPPPRSSLQSGILRQGTNAPTTPGTAKKRVQIQEISV
ncbi:uncharacterized protein Nlg2 [Chironomus tepperi]|uniref:uncharacterized protein Nlg2 n=1 Tax=Chironomus tepperi TaxID=113505 RepID=UPI00391F9C32